MGGHATGGHATGGSIIYKTSRDSAVTTAAIESCTLFSTIHFSYAVLCMTINPFEQFNLYGNMSIIWEAKHASLRGPNADMCDTNVSHGDF